MPDSDSREMQAGQGFLMSVPGQKDLIFAKTGLNLRIGKLNAGYYELL
jgi:hypothetical protein